MAARITRNAATILVWAFAVVAGVCPAAGQDLPPAMEVDRLLLLAERQSENREYKAALETLDRVLALQSEHSVDVPASVWFRHAQAALRAGFPERVRASVVRYLEAAGRDGEHYKAALELINEAEVVAAGGQRREIEAVSRPRDIAVPEVSGGGMASGTVFSDCAACPEMVVVPPGRFMMGSPTSDAEGFSDERPQHAVWIGAPFAVGVYEVTFAEWDACVRAGGCGGHRPDDSGWGRGRRPVMDVSWEDAQAYVQWLSRETGQRYRLLTEAEWEYVARAGTATGRYWGQSESGQCRYANGDDDFTPCPDGHLYSAPVGSFQPNLFGLYDVLGNVREWTEDCLNDDYSNAPADGSAWQCGDCSQRVVRGGSWLGDPRLLRSAYRVAYLAGFRSYRFGFRVARTMN